MGIDKVALETILLSIKYINSNRQNALTLARQQFHRDQEQINHYLKKYNLTHLANRYNPGDYFEQLFYDLGFQTVDSIDYSDYENANIIHNLNNPIPSNMKKYQYIYDGGTIEHIFNMPQVCENIVNLLDIGGIFCSVTVNNNFSGHGIYQFSPEFFLSAFSKEYGMEIQQLYLAKNETEIESWIDVNNFNKENGGRNCARFFSNDEVYILTIAKKISNVRKNFITQSPNQYSYEQIDWANSNITPSIKDVNDVIFVTAFKDIGRNNYSHYKRSNDKYFESFFNIASNIEYTLVVYLEENIKNELLKKYTFKPNIIFVDMDKVDTFYDKFLEKDKIIIQSEIYKNKIPEDRKFNPEHIYSEYNLINHSKINFVKNCSTIYPNYSFYSWVDFGYISPNIPNNLSLTKLPEKVVYAAFKEPTHRINEDDMLRSDEIFIMGSSYIIHKNCIEEFECLYEKKIIEWQEKYVTDDDQNLLLQLYYDNPNIFHLIQSDTWASLYTKI
jgi:hypothetical protein